jgi:FAD/FMN-containing dehydrogenase
MDGLGRGSFEYGWLIENILSADVVLPGGERRRVGRERAAVLGPAGRYIVVGRRLRARNQEVA